MTILELIELARFLPQRTKMVDIKSIIRTVECLLAQGTPQAITYAALECRLAIEKICYDRLKIAHDYISHHDLRRWQPQHVVQTLIAEVDGHIASTFTFSMSSEPAKDQLDRPLTAEDFNEVKWVELGTQVGFNPQILGALWQALSHLALHVQLPKTKSEIIPDYGDEIEISKKVEETLTELKRLAAGTLISSGFGQEVSFQCDCGRTIKRRSELLRHGHIINCVGIDCPASYDVAIDGDDIKFAPRHFSVDCKCGLKHRIPRRMTDKLPTDKVLNIECKCGEHFRVVWKAMLERRDS